MIDAFLFNAFRELFVIAHFQRNTLLTAFVKMASVLFCLMSEKTPSGSNEGRVEAALPCLGHSQGDGCSQAFRNKRTLMFSPGPFPAVMHWYKSSLLFYLFDLSFQDRKLDFAGVDSVLNTLVLNSYHLQ